jgi:hypothetical protein
MNIWMTLKKALNLYPEKIGVIDANRSFTYRQIGEFRAKTVSQFLKSIRMHIWKLTMPPPVWAPFSIP